MWVERYYENNKMNRRQNGTDMGTMIYYRENGLIKEIGENTTTGYKIMKAYTDSVISTTYEKYV